MGSFLQGLNLSKQGMSVNQAGLSLVSNNIANMNTAGYSKQRVDFAQGNFFSEANKVSISGVQLDGIIRYRDNFMDRYYRDENTVMSYYQEFVNNGKFVEDTMNELSGTGVTGALNKYYAAAQALANDPTSPTVRNDFIQQASKVATEFNSKTQTLEDYRKMLAGDATNIDSVESSQLSGYVKTVNALLDELTNVNTKISTTYNAGAQPNALMDKRDLLLDQLSELVPVKTEDLPDGQISVSIAGVQLINGTEKRGKLQVAAGDANNPSVVSVVDPSGNAYNVNFKDGIGSKGKIGAILELCGNDSGAFTIKSILDELDALAAAFAQNVNEIQQYREYDAATPPNLVKSSMCLNAAGTQVELATEPLFVPNTGNPADPITAKNIKINNVIVQNPNELATSIADVNPADPTQPQNLNAVGGNAAAKRFLEMRSQAILGGATSEDKMNSLISNVGLKVKAINSNAETQADSMTIINQQRDATFGVSLDEELVDMLKYQRAYEASARIFNVMDQIMKIMTSLGDN